MCDIRDKESMIEANYNYFRFYSYQHYHLRYNSKTPIEALNNEKPTYYRIAFNPRITKNKTQLA